MVMCEFDSLDRCPRAAKWPEMTAELAECDVFKPLLLKKADLFAGVGVKALVNGRNYPKRC